MSLRRRGAGLWLALTLLGLVMAAPVAAQSPADWLGLTPASAARDRGVPAEIFAVAPEGFPPQAVHFYSDHTYLFWMANRVWQVRLDRLWAGQIQGVAMGTPRADVEAQLGEPVARSDAWSVWNLPYQTFPRRLRLVFTDGLLTDAFLYRSDL